MFQNSAAIKSATSIPTAGEPLGGDKTSAGKSWVDYPGHIWAQYWDEGAVYSPDGMTIQFDNGSVWQRYVPLPALNSRGY
jgi:hypothetical protein